MIFWVGVGIAARYSLADRQEFAAQFAVFFASTALIVWLILYFLFPNQISFSLLKKDSRWKSALGVLLLGGCFGLYYPVYAEGFARLPASTATVLNYLWPVFWYLREVGKKLSNLKNLLVILIYLFGVIVFLGFYPYKLDLYGFLFMVFAAILQASLVIVEDVFVKEGIPGQKDKTAVFVGLLVGLPIFILPYSVVRGAIFMLPRVKDVISIIYVAIMGVAVGYYTWLRALAEKGERKKIQLVGILMLVPIVTEVAAALLLGEPLNVVLAISGTTVFVGGILVQWGYLRHRAFT
jgi:drug/metabolite transporter (DMT)-like permease